MMNSDQSKEDNLWKLENDDLENTVRTKVLFGICVVYGIMSVEEDINLSLIFQG